MSTISPYGTWPSPLSAASVTAAAARIEGARFVGSDHWWGQSIAEEGGRTAVRRRAQDGTVIDVLPAPWNARSRVHEYGGGAWTTADDGMLIFVEASDQRVWALVPGAEPRALTPADEGMRFGGLTCQGGQVLAIRETHGASRMPRRDIVSIALDGSGVTPIVAGSDFLAHPALSPSGRHLAWVAWDHPAMPWDRSQVRVGRLADGVVAEWTSVTGGETAALQPVWVDDDTLLYADDPTGRWNLWMEHLSADLERHPVAPADADTGGPVWVLGTRWYNRLDDGRIVAVRTDGDDEIVLVDRDGTVHPLPVPLSSQICIEDVSGTRVLISGASADSPGALWAIEVDAPEDASLIHGGPPEWAQKWMPRSRAVAFDGPRGPVHAFDYPPTNPEVTAPAGERPPYIVFVHGGPTSHVGGGASGKIAYFTSRGIGVLDVNYGGSSGYGRAYRERLLGEWGVVDVEDVIASARGLVDQGSADADRLAIAGGSAGGWTVLCSLVASDVFGAGISRYGVADLRMLLADTHDFESRYLDSMVGPLPEARQIYVDRSPLSHLDRLRTPLLIEQGLDDRVVPPSQSEAVRDALAERGVAHAYLAFEGEGHGFRRAENVIQALESELAFLGAVFGFDTPGVGALSLS